MCRSALADHHAAESTAIPVERIGRPVLLVSGDDELMWPSTMMAETSIPMRVIICSSRHKVASSPCWAALPT